MKTTPAERMCETRRRRRAGQYPIRLTVSADEVDFLLARGFAKLTKKRLKPDGGVGKPIIFISYERQIELAKGYVEEQGLEFAELTFKDLGVSTSVLPSLRTARLSRLPSGADCGRRT